MSNAPLVHFNCPGLLRRVGQPLLLEFFARFNHLYTPRHVLPAPDPGDDGYFDRLTNFVQRDDLPEPLLQALREIEAAANAAGNGDTAPHLVQAIHQWLQAGTSEREASEREASGPSEREALAATPSTSESADQSKIKNQKSKIETPPPSGSAPSLHHSTTPSLQSAPSPSLHHSITPPLQSEPAPASPSDFDRLALLTPFQYDRVRKAEAKRLNLRLRTLDDAVDDARTLLDDAEADNLGVRLLEPWPEPILNAPELFDQIHDCYPIYLYLPAGAAVILTLWPAHAHVLNAFTHTPRLHLTSAKPGCGKSTVFDVVAAFCPRVLHTNNLRPAVLYRGMHGGQLIVALLDELEYYVQRFPELNGLLNASNKRGTLIHRCEGNKVRAFKIFAATGLSGLGHLVPTVLDRSISLHLLEAPKGVLKARFIPEEAHAEKILGRKLARWAQDNYDAIAATAANPVMPDAAYNRLGDNWRPLFALAQVIGGHWPERLTAAFHALSSSPSDPQLLTLNSQLLGDIHHIFTRTSASRIFSADLVTALCALPDRPWSGNKNGHRPLTQATLARQLAPFKIFPLLLRIGDRRAKGYCATDFGHPAK